MADFDTMATATKHAETPTEATCPVCKTVFVPTKPWQRFCHVNCRSKYHRVQAKYLKMQSEEAEKHE